jgi:hypothetical protein
MTEMDRGTRLWLLKTARKHFWRVVTPSYEMDDLIQDGFVCYERVIAMYERRDYVSPRGNVTKGSPRVRKRSHIMRLFQVSFVNHINELSKRRTVNAIEVLAADLVPITVESEWDAFVTDDSDLMQLERLIAEAPRMLQPVLREIISETNGECFREPYRVFIDGQRETFNERLCKIAGLDCTKVDIATMLRSYLQGRLLSTVR